MRRIFGGRISAATLIAAMATILTLAVAAPQASAEGPIRYNGGPVQHRPHVYLIFWGSNWNEQSAARTAMTELFRWMSNSSFEGILTQYFDQNGPVGHEVDLSSYTDTRSAHPNEVSEESLNNEISYSIGAQGWSSPNLEDDYLVLTPPGSTYASGFQVGCAFHRYAPELGAEKIFDPWPSGQYSGCLEGYTDLQVLEARATHEFSESVADPTPPRYFGVDSSGWLNSNDGTDELADVCASLPLVEKSGFWVQKIFDNYLHGCAAEDIEPVRYEPVVGTPTIGAPHAATLNGVVVPAGYPATYQFEVNGPGGQSFLPGSLTSVGSSVEGVSVSNEITGLKGEATYSVSLRSTSEMTESVAESGHTTVMTSNTSFATPDWRPALAGIGVGEVIPHEATISGTINPEASDTHYQVEWGTTSAYGKSAPASPLDIGSGTGAVPFSQKLLGLKGRTTYHYRVVAWNGEGTTYGPDQEFTTPDWRPEPVAEHATAITEEEATLEGKINSENATTEYHWEYGLTPSYGTSVPIPSANLPAGLSPVHISKRIGELKPETTYYYRIVATNEEGTRYSDERTFATLTTRATPAEFLDAFGGPGSGEGELKEPRGIAIGANGDVWVADTGNNRVEKFDPNGAFLMEFGQAGSGPGEFESPVDVAVNGAGDVWVADEGNKRLEEFAPNGEFLRQANVAKEDPGIVPASVAVSEGSVFTTDARTGGLVEFSESTEKVTRVAFTFEASLPVRPAGLAAAGDELWTLLPYNHRIYAYQFRNLSPYAVYLWAEEGSGEAQLDDPGGIAIRPSGNLLVADTGNNRIEQLSNANGEELTEYGSKGSGPEQFSEPTAVAEAPGGYEYVVDSGNDRIDKWAQPGLAEAWTLGVSEVGEREAKLEGEASAVGRTSTYQFEYGPTSGSGYPHTIPAPAASLGAEFGVKGVSQSLSGLEPGAKYRYRLSVTNKQGTAYGEEQTFWTTAKPRVEEESATSLTSSTEKVEAKIWAGALATTYQVEYGTTPAYGTSFPVPAAGAGSSPSEAVHVIQSLEGLEPETLYYFRVTAVNSDGTVHGAGGTFKTLSGATAGQLSAMRVTDPFNATTSAVSNFGSNWGALGWAGGSTPKGLDNSGGWGPSNAYSTVNGAYFAPQLTDSGQGIAAQATMSTNPSIEGRYFSLWLDLQTPTGARAGYQLLFTVTGFNVYRVELDKWQAGTKTVLGTKEGYAFSNGDSLALSDQGSTVTAWVNKGSGFESLLAATDSTFSGGEAGVEGSGNITRLTNFKAGSLLAHVASTGQAIEGLPVITPFSKAESPLSEGGNFAALSWDTGSTKTGHVSSGWGPSNAYPEINGAYWTRYPVPDTGSGDGIAATLATRPSNASRYFALWLNAPSPGLLRSGYELVFTETTASSGLYEVQLDRWEAGTKTVLASTSSYSFPLLGRFALIDKGGVVSIWTNTGTEYKQLLSASSGTFTSGYGAVEGSGNITRLTNLQLGQLAPSE